VWGEGGREGGKKVIYLAKKWLKIDSVRSGRVLTDWLKPPNASFSSGYIPGKVII